MKFIIHGPTGNILRTGSCPDAQLRLQAGKGETAIEDTFDDTDDTKHRIVNGGRVEFTPYSPTPEIMWAPIKARRNALLLACDWTDTLSAPARLGTDLYAAWQTYRQALRDVTSQPDQYNIIWPTSP